MEPKHRILRNKEVSRLLSIGESSLRKWCIELEKNGYEFERGLKDSRAFNGRDVLALIAFKEMVQDRVHTAEQAARIISDEFSLDRKEIEQIDSKSKGKEDQLNRVEKKIDELRSDLNKILALLEKGTNDK